MATKRIRKMPKGFLNSPSLISVVAKYPVIWDFGDLLYHNSGARDQAWEKVAEAFFDATARECQLKWEAIKRAFANSRRRQRMRELSGAAANRSKPYKYSKLLSFLDGNKIEEDDVQDGNLSETVSGDSQSDMESVDDVSGCSALSMSQSTAEIHDMSSGASPEEMQTVVQKRFDPLLFQNVQQNSQDFTTPQQSGLLFAFRLEKELDKVNNKCNQKKDTKLKNPNGKKEVQKENLAPMRIQLQTPKQEISQKENLAPIMRTPLQPRKQEIYQNKENLPPIRTKSETLQLLVSDSDTDIEPEEDFKKTKQTKRVKLQKERERKREAQTKAIKDKVKLSNSNNRLQQHNEPPQHSKEIDLNEILKELAKPEDPHTHLGIYLGYRLKNVPNRNRSRFVAEVMNALCEYDEDNAEDKRREREKPMKDELAGEERSEREKPTKTLLTSHHFSAKEEAAIDEIFESKETRKTLTIIDGLQITVQDLQTLKQGAWVNDMVINAYFGLLAADYKCVHSLSTFFYEDLCNENKDSMCLVPKVPLFSFQKILIPINKNRNHWVLAVLDMVNHNIKYYDSMGGNDIHCPSKLLSFLEKTSQASEDFLLEVENSQWSATHVQAPRQSNGHDCGTFICAYAEYEARGVAIDFTQEDMPLIRRKVALSIMSGKIL